MSVYEQTSQYFFPISNLSWVSIFSTVTIRFALHHCWVMPVTSSFTVIHLFSIVQASEVSIFISRIILISDPLSK